MTKIFPRIIACIICSITLSTKTHAAEYNYNFLTDYGINVIDRAEWGCPDLDPESPSYCFKPEWQGFKNPITHIVIHHTATTNNATDWEAEVRNVWKLQSINREWSDIAYNYLIDPNGKIYEGKQGGEFVDGGHIGVYSYGTVGIALLGNYEAVQLSDKAYQSLVKLTAALADRYKLHPLGTGISIGNQLQSRVSGHFNWNSTQCPGKYVISRLNEIRQDVAQSMRIQSADTPLCPSEFTLSGKVCVKDEVRKSTEISNSFDARDFETDSRGKQYFTNYNGNAIYALNVDGSLEVITSFVIQTMDMLLDEENNQLYALQFASDTVLKVDLTRKEISLVGYTGDGPRSITKDADGNLYIASIYDNAITKIDTEGVSTFVATTQDYPVSVKIDSKGNIYTANFMADSVTKVTPDGKVTHIPVTGKLPKEISIDQNDVVFVLNEGTGTIDRISNNKASLYVELPLQANEMSRESNGDLFVLHNNFNAYSIVNTNKEIKTYYLDSNSKQLFFYNPALNKMRLIDPTTNKFYEISTKKNEENALFPVFRFWSNTMQSHFYTADKGEKDYIVENYSPDVWKFEGSIMRTFIKDDENTKPVYRFWNDSKKSHLYTIDPIEKKKIEDTNSAWKYEGIAMYAYASKQNDASIVPVYRFWSNTQQKHFYTSSLSEKEGIERDYPKEVWQYEGVGYYTYEL